LCYSIIVQNDKNKKLMKKIFLGSIMALMFLFAGSQSGLAQGSSNSTDDATASLNISKNILKIIGSLAKDFTDMKGEFLTKTDDGTNVYGVKNIEGMMAEAQYIMVKSGGAMYYVASYSGDTKKLAMSFAAFTGGVTTITNSDASITVTQNKEKSTADVLVYTMSIKGTKIGSFSMEVKKQEGTMIIGFL
jgi:hypothetical protein